MPSPAVRGYRFAGFVLDLSRRRLSGPGQETLPLSGRAFEVLSFLLANRDRMVSKRELMDAVWPRMVVEENNLTQAISSLRRALGDSREAPQFIATIAGRGYQFVGAAQPFADAPEESPASVAPAPVEPAPPLDAVPAPVEPTAEPVGEPPVPPVAAAGLSRRRWLIGAGAVAVVAATSSAWVLRRGSRSRLPASIAVLPFKPLLTGSRNEAIEIGVSELLINRLSALPGLVVKPLSSVRKYSSVEQDPFTAGRELGVAAVLDGTVQMQNDTVRLTARLLDVSTGASLWAGDYTDRLGDFFAMQDSLVTQLVAALAVDVPMEARERLVAHSTTDSAAWQLYANGRYQLERRDPEGIARAKQFFEAAIERDPRFALAITGLSEAWALSGTFALMPPREAFEQARRAAGRALEIDPRLAPALVALGHVKTQLDHDWAAGRLLYQQGLSIEPNAGWGHAWLALNLIQSSTAAAALDHIARAQALEPAAVPFMALSGFIHYHARQFEAAKRQLSGILEFAPNAVLARQFLARVLLAQGEAADVVRLLEGRNGSAPGSYSNLARAYAMTGRRDAALAELAKLETERAQGFGVGYDCALIHLALGDADSACAALLQGIDDASQMIGYVNVDPALDRIRDDPRVREVARRIGLA